MPGSGRSAPCRRRAAPPPTGGSSFTFVRILRSMRLRHASRDGECPDPHRQRAHADREQHREHRRGERGETAPDRAIPRHREDADKDTRQEPERDSGEVAERGCGEEQHGYNPSEVESSTTKADECDEAPKRRSDVPWTLQQEECQHRTRQAENRDEHQGRDACRLNLPAPPADRHPYSDDPQAPISAGTTSNKSRRRPSTNDTAA